jgi:hypothetical protein
MLVRISWVQGMAKSQLEEIEAALAGRPARLQQPPLFFLLALAPGTDLFASADQDQATGGLMAKKLTNAWVAKMVRARGLKASPADLKQLTRMMNEDLKREQKEKQQEAEKAAFQGPPKRARGS